jgi:PAS domain S-box-containing protein
MHKKLPLPPAATEAGLLVTSSPTGVSSEAQLRMLADLTTDLLWSSDAQGRVSWGNRRWYEYTGQAPAEAGTHGWLDAWHPDDQGRARQHMQAAEAAAYAWHLEGRLRSAAGDYHWFEVHAQPVPESNGQWLVAATDIQERKLAEVALHESQERYQTLFEAMDQGFCIVEVLFDETQQPVDYRFLVTNPAFEHQTGLYHAVGQRMQELRPAHEAHWVELYGQIARTGEAQRFSQPARQLEAFYEGYAFRVGEPTAHKVAILFSDISAAQRTEAALRASEASYHTLFNSIDEGYFLCDVLFDEQQVPVDIFYQDANPAASRLVGADYRGKRLHDIDPTYEGYWTEIFGRVAQTGVGERLERYAEPDKKWFDFYISKVGDEASRRVAVVFQDSTERKQHEQALRASEAQLAADLVGMRRLYELQAKLADQTDVQVAFQDVLALACEFTGTDRGCVQFLSQDGQQLEMFVWQGYPDDSPFINFFRYEGLEAGCEVARVQRKRLIIEDTVGFEGLEGTEAGVAAYADGIRAAQSTPMTSRSEETIGVISTQFRQPHRPSDHELRLLDMLAWTAAEFLERHRAEAARRESEALLQKAFSIDTVGQLYFTLDGGMTKANQAFVRMSGYNQEELRTTNWEMLTAPEFWDETAHHAGELAERGETAPYEKQFVRPDGSRWWGLCAPTRLRGQGPTAECMEFIVDISERKCAEQQLRAFAASLEQQVAERTQALRENQELLQLVFDTSPMALSVQEAVRDAQGDIQDFRVLLLNKELTRELGRSDMVGKYYVQEYPGLRASGLFELMRTTVETGEPQHTEYFYPYEGLNRWFSSMFVKLNDGVVATKLDITPRKQAEEERFRNFALLQQSEEVAGMGSWDYHVATGVFHWSDGMYRLFDLPLGTPVTPSVYLDVVLAEDLPIAERLVHKLRQEPSCFEKQLRVWVGGQVKTLRLKAEVLRDAAGQPERVLGVDLDISQVQRLEADNLHLRLSQQQALFEAVQQAQETERKRIAEGLHNGVGQLLFATKLRLDQLHTPALNAEPALAAARHEADRLLADAIRQTRVLSHELVPTVLEEFGLAAAVQDICRQLSTPQLRLRGQVVLDEEVAPLPALLQLALYRMAQELGLNIVKHARGATQASLELETTPGFVLLRAEDDGAGFSTDPAASTGLGLRTIRNRVALLNGILEQGHQAGLGTFVRLRIPLPVSPTASVSGLDKQTN